MPDGFIPMPLKEAAGSAEPTAADSYGRPHVLAFVIDAGTEAALREGLAEMAEGIEIRRGGIRTAAAALQKIATPKVLIVDVSGEEQPLAALGMLSDVVEPDVCVLVVGDMEDLGFYRAVTRNLGAMEYLAKPLSRDLVSQHFGPAIRGQSPSNQRVSGGRLVTITGVRGGVGASVVAASLAWHFGATMRRHTMLLDADLHRGTAALLLDIDVGQGLAAALESPERIDALLAERVALPAADRLHVLASQSDLAHDVVCAPGAATILLETLRQRYNAIVADVPFAPSPLPRELLQAAEQRVLVMTPSLASVRDALRMLALTGSAGRAHRAVVVLNRLGMPGGLSRKQIEDALSAKVDVVIPDLPRQVNAATLIGQPAGMRGAFRAGILELARQVGLFRTADLADAAALAPRLTRKLLWLRRR